MLTTVVHCNREPYDVFIGRTHSGMHLGNPFGITGTPTGLVVWNFPNATEAIEAYRQWLAGETYYEIEPARRRWILRQLPSLRGKRLGCFCRPLTCHGDVLIKLLEHAL